MQDERMLTEDMERELERAAEVLESGGVVVYPTETCLSYTSPSPRD